MTQKQFFENWKPMINPQTNWMVDPEKAKLLELSFCALSPVRYPEKVSTCQQAYGSVLRQSQGPLTVRVCWQPLRSPFTSGDEAEYCGVDVDVRIWVVPPTPRKDIFQRYDPRPCPRCGLWGGVGERTTTEK